MSVSQIPDDTFIRRSFQLPAREVGYLRFLVEGYDGLLFLRTLDGRVATVEISYPPSREAEAAEVLAALQAEVGLAAPQPPPFPAS